MKAYIILAAILCTGLVMTGSASAQDSNAAAPEKEVISNTTTRTIRPLAIDGQTKELKPAIQRFIERVNMARYALSQRNPQVALADITEAEKHLDFIKSNSRIEENKEKMVIASGHVVSEGQESFNSYYVPLEEGPVVVKSLEATDSQTGQNNINGLAVKSVDLVYLNVDLAGQTAPDALAKARMAIKDGDLKAADKALADMINTVATTTVVNAMPITKAEDNLRLAFKFLQSENYTATRYALDQAVNALKEAQSDRQYKGDNVASLISKTTQIRDMVMQETTAAAQKARTQIISVQNQISKIRS